MFIKPKNSLCSTDLTVDIFYPVDPINNVVSGVYVISSITRHYFSLQTVVFCFFLNVIFFSANINGSPPVYCAAVATGYNSYLKTSATNEKHLRGSIPPGGNGKVSMSNRLLCSLIMSLFIICALCPLPCPLYYLLTLSPSHTKHFICGSLLTYNISQLRE